MIGRIEYTSCEDGVDGIRGFQIRAMTPDIADPLRTVAVRDSVYEPPPGAPSMPEPDELARFPVSRSTSGTVRCGAWRQRAPGR
jgi:hypothetical protein